MSRDYCPTVPKQYVSISDGKARVIHGGIPTCADTTFRDALSIFRRQFPQSDLNIYNGNSDFWVSDPEMFVASFGGEPDADMGRMEHDERGDN